MSEYQNLRENKNSREIERDIELHVHVHVHEHVVIEAYNIYICTFTIWMTHVHVN